MHDIRRKRWSDVLDQAKQERATLRGTQVVWAQPYWDALDAVRTERRRTRRDYFTHDDRNAVQSRAYPDHPTNSK